MTAEICSNKQDLTAERGFIISPQYPISKTLFSCENRIVVPSGKSINIWIVDLLIGGRDSLGKYESIFIIFKHENE
jgi:hypothetical protein